MRNEYTAPEVIEIGEAQEVILGQKTAPGVDGSQPNALISPDSDLDE
jgi:hypothetical protein